MDRPLRLITASPVDRLARTIEALLVVASQPLSVEELATATDDGVERVETALRLLAERYAEGRSGIVLEHVAGGWAFRAAREAAEACGRLFERPVQKGLSPAALETLAIVAYLGPCSRPDIARIRGVAADSAVASLLDRGLIAEAGREEGAIRYRTTPLFERVFGLESLSALPRLDDLAPDAEELRTRLRRSSRRSRSRGRGTFASPARRRRSRRRCRRTPTSSRAAARSPPAPRSRRCSPCRPAGSGGSRASARPSRRGGRAASGP